MTLDPTCDNGLTDTGTVVFQPGPVNFLMAFSLSSGERGQVTFAFM